MINLGLSRISLLLSRLPTPQTWTAIHIAGTNGKGSVAAYLSSLLRRLARPSDTSDLRIGKFTSPHLIDRWDCITINDAPVSQSLFLSVEEHVQRLSETTGSTSTEQKPTEFELLTATAFEIFSRQKCQVGIIECGLGGRLDATNALDPHRAAVCVITKIGLDHQGLLGNTVEEIAREKAGIAKSDIPFIYDGSNVEPVKIVLENEAKARGATEILQSSPTDEPSFSQLAPHQRQNMTLALQAYAIASTRIPSLTLLPAHTHNSLIAQTLSDTAAHYPGRLHHLSVTSPVPSLHNPILLDGAHNPQSATILRSYIDAQNTTGEGKRTWVLGMSRGKDQGQILDVLLRAGDEVVTCPFGPVDGMPWVKCVEAEELARGASERVGVERVQTASDVVQALEIAGRDGPRMVVVAGSLYLVSDLLRALRDGVDVMRSRLHSG